MEKSITYVFKESIKKLAGQPILVLPTIIALIFIILLSNLSIKLNYIIGNGSVFVNTAWLIIFSLISLFIISYFFSGLLSMCYSSLKSNATVKDFFSGTKKYWFKTFVLMLIILICYAIINYLSISGALLIGKYFSLSVEIAKFLLYFIYFALIIGALIFLSFSNFILVSENKGIIESIKRSASFVSDNYSYVIIIGAIFFFIDWVVSKLSIYSINNFINLSEVISSLVIYPLLSLILTMFLQIFKEK